MAKLGGIYVSVRAKTDQYKRDLADAKTLTEKAAVRIQHGIDSITFTKAAAAAVAFGAAIAKVGYDGFQAMEQMKLSTASLAATITSFAKDADKDLAGTYQQALNYSGQLVLKMEELNAQTIATGDNLMTMVETMAHQGILLDINNKKQMTGFLAIANALAAVTGSFQNQAAQFGQEMRALMTGQTRHTDSLALLLKQKVGGNLKENIKLWREQGTLIESVGALLEGFSEGAKDLENTWAAVGTTLSTLYNKVLRGMIAPVYMDIIAMGKQITLNALDQNSALNKNANTLKTVVYRGWQDIKNITEVAVDTVMAFEAPLKFIGMWLGAILDGWGQILAILPAITDRLKLMTQAIFESVKMVGNFGAALWHVASGEFKNAANAWKAAKKNWAESGRKTGEVFADGFGDEIFARIAEYNKNLTTIAPEPAAPPALKAPTAPVDSEKELKKLKDNASKMAAIYTELYKTTGLEEYAQKAIAANTAVMDMSMDSWMEILKNEQAVNDLRIQEANKFHDELYSQEIEARLKAEEEKLKVIKEFNEKYEEMGLDKFELERLQLEREVEIYRQAGVEKNKIDEMVARRSEEIARAEQTAKLNIYQSIAGGIADTFKTIADAGGKQSKEAFMVYKAAAIAEATIAGHQAILKALASAAPPYNFVLAGIAGAATAVQIGMIASAQPPSYDVGGVSNARGIYQTGNIREAHVPIPSGKIPVEINGGQEQKAPEITIMNSVDPQVMDAWAASSRGQNAIFNIIGSQPQRLRKLAR